jgi:hypothetical protein
LRRDARVDQSFTRDAESEEGPHEARLAIVPFARGPKIIEIIPPGDDGAYLRVNVELQEDFSMDQALSLYLHETIPLLDPEAPDYALDLVTLVESILEDPDIILRKQLDRVKDQKMAEMKMEGIEYQERMDELEKLEHPKPKREFIYSTFNAFADRHPWVGRKTFGRNRSRAKCSSSSVRSRTTSRTTNCSALKASCCAICRASTKC